MSAPSPLQVQQLLDQRVMARRALGRGRWWFMRGAIMMVVAIVAAWQGGQVYRFLAVVLVILAAMSISLGRSIRRGAQEALAKIDLMEGRT
jgi:hypothetical protein